MNKTFKIAGLGLASVFALTGCGKTEITFAQFNEEAGKITVLDDFNGFELKGKMKTSGMGEGLDMDYSFDCTVNLETGVIAPESEDNAFGVAMFMEMAGEIAYITVWSYMPEEYVEGYKFYSSSSELSMVYEASEGSSSAKEEIVYSKANGLLSKYSIVETAEGMSAELVFNVKFVTLN